MDPTLPSPAKPAWSTSPWGTLPPTRRTITVAELREVEFAQGSLAGQHVTVAYAAPSAEEPPAITEHSALLGTAASLQVTADGPSTQRAVFAALFNPAGLAAALGAGAVEPGDALAAALERWLLGALEEDLARRRSYNRDATVNEQAGSNGVSTETAAHVALALAARLQGTEPARARALRGEVAAARRGLYGDTAALDRQELAEGFGAARARADRATEGGGGLQTIALPARFSEDPEGL